MEQILSLDFNQVRILSNIFFCETQSLSIHSQSFKFHLSPFSPLLACYHLQPIQFDYRKASYLIGLFENKTHAILQITFSFLGGKFTFSSMVVTCYPFNCCLLLVISASCDRFDWSYLIGCSPQGYARPIAGCGQGFTTSVYYGIIISFGKVCLWLAQALRQSLQNIACLGQKMSEKQGFQSLMSKHIGWP